MELDFKADSVHTIKFQNMKDVELNLKIGPVLSYSITTRFFSLETTTFSPIIMSCVSFKIYITYLHS